MKGALAAMLPQLFNAFNRADDIREPDAEFFVDDHGFAARHQFAVHIDFQRLARELVQFNDRPLSKLEQFIDEQSGAAKFRGHVKGNVKNEVKLAAAVVGGR